MMASVDAEADMENLFAGDDVHQDGGMDTTQTLTQEEEQQRAEGGANLDVTGAGEVKKRVIRNPQPKLNPERLMGPRGVQTIEDLFGDWESKGKGKEFDDLEVVMKRMEHWAHRLYPKLPFDSVLDVVANRLGKKKAIQTHVKKIRLGMVTETVHVGGGEVREEEDEREVERYGEEEQPDVFGELLRRAGGEDVPLPPVQRVGQTGGLTEEQRERIRRNKELAAQKKKEKQEREQREAEEELRKQQEMGSDLEDLDEIEREMMSAPSAAEWSQGKTQKQSNTEVETRNDPVEAAPVIDIDPHDAMSSQVKNSQEPNLLKVDEVEESKKPAEEESEELVGLDEMLEQMDED